ncbi:hypothetical protein SRABI27_03736 [Pedobacter sp. Bi27]|uniref:hypothetical protein n=1 Tax=Pedobacter sp. Bi27 TaxID=2822351 RepID=UPI001D568323|nr:hypothetical protein [Pedobacter sp. Bi27]CAH0279623.1 hypothetical protein SRABI27_03736 [Pedobacter sp. Bi27]
MPNWNPNNLACTTLWTTLFKMKQLDSNFTDSGALKMSELLYFNPLGTAADKLKSARIMADQLDVIFRFGRGAVYEDSIDREKAMEVLVPILLDADKLVEDLASAADDIYHFWQEPVNV